MIKSCKNIDNCRFPVSKCKGNCIAFNKSCGDCFYEQKMFCVKFQNEVEKDNTPCIAFIRKN